MSDANTTAPLSRNSHYTPRAYYKPWCGRDDRIEAYRLLVPAESYPLWQRVQMRSIPVRRDLYTSAAAAAESDDTERWLHREVENPAVNVLAKLRAGNPLSAADRRPLARYLAALQVRGPVSYSNLVTGVATMLDGELPGIVERAVETVTTALESGQALPDVPPVSTPALNAFRIRVTPAPSAESPDRRVIEVNAVIGRELWLENIRQVVDELSPMLEPHAWQVIAPHPGWRWFTSDDPFMRLQYHSPENHNFNGGWASPGTELLLPLSPTQMLYAQVGRPAKTMDAFPLEHTVVLQRLVAEHAHRWIMSDTRPARVPWFRPRSVDRAHFIAEEEQWDRYHDEQARAIKEGPFEHGFL